MATLTGRLTFFLLLFFFAVDHSRVRLATVDGIAGTDYINANFCDVSVTSENYSSDRVRNSLITTANNTPFPRKEKKIPYFFFFFLIFAKSMTYHSN